MHLTAQVSFISFEVSKDDPTLGCRPEDLNPKSPRSCTSILSMRDREKTQVTFPPSPKRCSDVSGQRPLACQEQTHLNLLRYEKKGSP